MRLRGWVSLGAIACGVWVGQGCGGDQFTDSKGTGAASGSGGGAGDGGGVGGTTGGAGGAAAGAGGAPGGAAGSAAGMGGTTGGAGGATGGTTGTGATGGLPACSGSGVCAPAVPGGWQGPLTIVDANSKTAPACGGGYPNEIFVAHNQLSGSAPAPGCSCVCDGSSATCKSVQVAAYNNAGCTGATCCAGTPCTTVTLNSGACVQGGTSLCSAVSHAIISATTTPCTPAVDANLDNIAWTRSIRGCAPAAQGNCGSSGTCVPNPAAPTTGKLCISKDGNQPCPGEYTQAIHTWKTDDKRGCAIGSCGCTAPACGSIQPFGALNCTGTPMGSDAVPLACNTAIPSSGVMSMKYTALAKPTCAPTGGPKASGELQQQELTVCCLP